MLQDSSCEFCLAAPNKWKMPHLMLCKFSNWIPNKLLSQHGCSITLNRRPFTIHCAYQMALSNKWKTHRIYRYNKSIISFSILQIRAHSEQLVASSSSQRRVPVIHYPWGILAQNLCLLGTRNRAIKTNVITTTFFSKPIFDIAL